MSSVDTRRSLDEAPLRLRAGDWVVVKSQAEILATLDSEGSVEKLPFMPEMVKYSGRRFKVATVAHKTCDPAHRTGGRRMDNAVHLEDLRCDGSAHGGCQAGCLLFWKTQWLKRVDSTESAAEPMIAAAAVVEPDQRLIAHARAFNFTELKPVYSCQATQLYHATTPLKWWDVRQYFRDVASRNVTVNYLAKILMLSWVRALMRVGVAYRAVSSAYRGLHSLLLHEPAPDQGSGAIALDAATPVRPLGLQTGQRVRVRSNGEILQTLNRNNKNRGLWFDGEAAIYCGGEFRVERRIERIINEVTGEMLEIKTPCITLDGVYCRGRYSLERLFCPRAIKPYWREIWLERCDEAQALPPDVHPPAR